MRKQCTTCGFWIALTADGVSYESENASHVGPLHAHQNELSDDMHPDSRSVLETILKKKP